MAGRTRTSASLHRGHNHRNNSQSSRSVGRKRRCERARTPSWWRRARVSSRRSVRVAWAAQTAAPVLKPPRIGCRVPSGDANVNNFCLDAILARECVQKRQICSVGDSPTGGKVRNLVAWVASVEETKRMKPTDKAIMRMVSESPGRNVREPVGGLDKKNDSGGRALSFGAKAAWQVAR